MIENSPIGYQNGITGAYIEEESEDNINYNEEVITNNESSHVYIYDEFIQSDF
ncbi:hypothetical protein KPL47_06030 [Clostridium estertheticum]|uniref:hypothetical protein n=1 Tax=Clostridium estertheticum TaxID=238834 RepID=UPI001C0DD713|nr:hypothetical protein [Clostridium estertheticum]MBU3175924.1 hypothetical protein [Clostridium estertheticum]